MALIFLVFWRIFKKVTNVYNKCIFGLFDLFSEVNEQNDIRIHMAREKCSLFVAVNKVLKRSRRKWKYRDKGIHFELDYS